jgi:hypothetical protein
MEIRYLLDKLALLEAEQLLAPNGKPSNLNPVQYQQVRTPEFKSWFGDWEKNPETASKVVDSNGEPAICYHGTSADFDEFNTDPEPEDRGDWVMPKSQVSYFTASLNYSYSKNSSSVMPVFLNIKNPFIPSAQSEIETVSGDKKSYLKSHGYDGIMWVKAGDITKGQSGWGDDYSQLAIFSSNQAKSAIGNTGSFSQQSNKVHEGY